MAQYDAVVVGAGPNGLAAAVTVASTGRSVLVLERAPTIGGGARTDELSLPGFRHDVCSAVHPTGVASPFFRSLPLDRHGLRWLHPEVVLAHPLDGGRAVLVHRSVDDTAEALGADADSYRRGIGWAAGAWPLMEEALLGPLLRLPRHPLAMARFGLTGIISGSALARRWFRTEQARAVFAGAAAHAILPLERAFTGSVGILFLSLAHAVGWPVAEGGSQAIVDALARHVAELGGVVTTNTEVTDLDDLPPAKAIFLDLVPAGLEAIAGARLPEAFRSRLRKFRYGPGVFKVDWALDGPVPWTNPEVSKAATVHIGGTLEEIEASERAPWGGEHASRPFLIAAQPTVVDPSRAPGGKHVLWAYCHVPNGSTVDMTERVEAQIERFAPGFRRTILARCIHDPARFQDYNPNYVGGDIAGGAMSGLQLLARPALRVLHNPYRTPLPGVYLCSASTPPGAGVHGMCGYWAAQSALKRELR